MTKEKELSEDCLKCVTGGTTVDHCPNFTTRLLAKNKDCEHLGQSMADGGLYLDCQDCGNNEMIIGHVPHE